ncbi:MAG: hypothetical protein SO287_12270 [Parabacteroides sp.]|nr:DUF4160 domain-containing protein [Parabacteroides sp.]MCI7009449.1 DUF4160 domain-containing protein [Parabacteroides sp.]MCI7781998.1 DUF4160 domain-containing protein [Parabacteroides sp.]MDY4758337.1 hypothetical protein [Parabacteroides sp.]
MNFSDNAPAHFHVWYNEYKVIVTISDGIVKRRVAEQLGKSPKWNSIG